MAQNNTQLNVDINVKSDQVAQADEKFVSLRRQIRETLVSLQELTDKGDTQSKKFSELNLKLAELRTEQEQVNNKTQSLTSTFSLMGGAVGEFGNQAEVGIQALKTLSSFTLQDIKNQFMVVGAELKTFITKIVDASGITKLYTITNEALAASFIEMGVAEESAAAAAKVLSGAIVATGIGALIVGVALLAANWDKVEQSLKGTTEEEDAFNEAVNTTNKDLEKFYENLISVRQTLDAAEKGVISKKEALKIYNETLGDSLGKVKTFEEAEKRANSDEAVKAYIMAQVKKAEAQAFLAKSAQAAVDAATGKGYDLGFWDKAYNAIMNAGNPVGYLVDNLKTGIENTKQLTKEAKIAAEEYGKLAPSGTTQSKVDKAKVDPRVAQAKAVQAELNKIEEDAYANTLEAKDKELYVAGGKYNDLLAKAKKYGLDTTALTEAYHTEITTINKKYDDKELSEEEKKRKAIEQFEVKLAQDLQKLDDKKKNDKIKEYDDDIKLLQAQEAALIKGSKAYFDIVQQIEDKSYEERKLKAKDNAKELDQIEINHKNNNINIKIQQMEAEKQIQLQTVDMYASFGQLLGQIAGKSKEIAIAALLIEKAAAVAKVVISTNAAIAEYTLQSLSLGPIAGPIAAASFATTQHINEAISIASIIAAAAVGISGISGSGGGGGSTTSSAPAGNSTAGLGKAYGLGGLLDGPSHSSGGIMINAEGGEAIMSRGAVTMFGPLLSKMNQAGGGTSFNLGLNGQAKSDYPKKSLPVTESQIIKTYVVEQDLTSAQHRHARLKDLSTL